MSAKSAPRRTASGPNEGWLDIAKTASAKAHIKKAIQKKNSDLMKEETIRRGTRARLESFAAQDIGEGEMEKLLEPAESLR
jgi:(p)ppGpp synthase/HD superfamily hydrolase